MITLLLSSIYFLGYSQQIKCSRYQVTDVKVCEVSPKAKEIPIQYLDKFCTNYIALDSGQITVNIFEYAVVIEQPNLDIIETYLVDDKTTVWYDKAFNTNIITYQAMTTNSKYCLLYISEKPVKDLNYKTLLIIRTENKIIYQLLTPLKL